MTRMVVSNMRDRALILPHLMRLAPLRYLRNRAARRRRGAFDCPLPGSMVGQATLAELYEQGVCTLSDLSALTGRNGADVLAALIASLHGAWQWQGDVAAFEAEAILRQMPEVYLLGLDVALLDLAEAYLGEACHYIGCTLKREAVSTSQDGPRRWHQDVESERIFRVILYLNPVVPGGGPFQYVTGPESDRARVTLRYRSGYLSDQRMATVVPEAAWRSALGGPGSAVLFDGARIFHRVAVPQVADRFSLSLTYTSRHPVRVRRSILPRAGTRMALIAHLSPRQLGCVPMGR